MAHRVVAFDPGGAAFHNSASEVAFRASRSRAKRCISPEVAALESLPYFRYGTLARRRSARSRIPHRGTCPADRKEQRLLLALEHCAPCQLFRIPLLLASCNHRGKFPGCGSHRAGFRPLAALLRGNIEAQRLAMAGNSERPAAFQAAREIFTKLANADFFGLHIAYHVYTLTWRRRSANNGLAGLPGSLASRNRGPNQFY